MIRPDWPTAKHVFGRGQVSADSAPDQGALESTRGTFPATVCHDCPPSVVRTGTLPLLTGRASPQQTEMEVQESDERMSAPAKCWSAVVIDQARPPCVLRAQIT